jgi:hypothetical protein
LQLRLYAEGESRPSLAAIGSMLRERVDKLFDVSTTPGGAMIGTSYPATISPSPA